ncbi:MAG: hypothetical protein WD770_01020 [Actinomycetota bacterium]
MVATIFLDWMLSLGVGLLFGRIGEHSHAPGAARLSSAGFRAGALAQLALMAVSVTLYAVSDDWMWMYWVDPAALPFGIVFMAFAMYAVAFLAGYLLAPELDRLRAGSSWVAIGLTAVAITVLEVTTWDRLTSLGTLSEFLAGRAGGLRGGFLAVLAVGGGVVIVLTAALLRALARIGTAPAEHPARRG